MKAVSLACLGLIASSGTTVVAQGGFYPPAVPTNNQVTTNKALLGMALFWEEQLSSANTTACGSCHVHETGGTDPRAVATVHPGPDGLYGTPDDIHGSAGVPARTGSGSYLGNSFPADLQVTRRKALTTLNTAYLRKFFYDGRHTDQVFRDPDTNAVLLINTAELENMVLQPLLDPVEMGHAGRTLSDVSSKLRQVKPLALASELPPRLQQFLQQGRNYDELFEVAFGTGNKVSAARIAMALATYLRTLVADRAPHDMVAYGLYQRTPSEERGFQLFSQPQGQSAACIQCHSDLRSGSSVFGPYFPNGGQGHMGRQLRDSHNIGVRPIAEDVGVGAVTNLQMDMGRFRTPQLRNIALNQTFFHNGGAKSLREVVEFYSRGGDFHVNQSWDVRPRNLSNEQIDDIIAFLHTLTDPRVAARSFPFDRPTLASETGSQYPIKFGGGTVTQHGAVTAVGIEPVYLGVRQATIAVRNATPDQLAFIAWDLSANPIGASFQGVQIFVGLHNTVMSFAGTTTADSAGSGLASLAFNLPSHPALSGTSLFAQWLVGEPAQLHGFVASDALRIDL